MNDVYLQHSLKSKVILCMMKIYRHHFKTFTYPQVISPNRITSLLFGFCLVFLIMKSFPSLPLLLVFIKLQNSASYNGCKKHKCDNFLHFDGAYSLSLVKTENAANSGSWQFSTPWRKSHKIETTRRLTLIGLKSWFYTELDGNTELARVAEMMMGQILFV